MATREQSPARTGWPRCLQGDDAEEVAARLSSGDPLELAPRSARRLRERWVLLEPERVHLRVLAVCARAARIEEPAADLQVWVLAKIDLAIEQLVRADLEAERARPELLSEEDMQFPLLTESLLLEPELVRAASVAFNALDDPPRRAFFELVIEGRTPPEVIESGPWDQDGLYRALQAALAPFGLDAPSGPEDDPADEGKA